MIAVLRRRNFALLWLGGLISLSGDMVLTTALPYFIFERTGSALASSLMLIAYITPYVLLGSVAGVFVDRWDRKRTMVWANLLRAALLPALLLIRSDDWLWVVYVVAFLESCVSAFFGPAEGALLPRLVGEEHLVPANSLNALNNNIARLAGPPLGGALLGLFGLPIVALVDSASYLIAAAMIGLVAAPRETAGEAKEEVTGEAASALLGVWREWLAGLRLVRGESFLASLFLVVGVATLADGAFNGLLVAFVEDVLQAGPAVFGWLITAQGVGGLLGGIVVGWLGGALGPARLLALSLCGIGGVILGIVNLRSVPAALVLGALGGLPVMGWLVAPQTLLQSSVPDRYLGRVLGAYGTTTALLRLAGLGVSAALADAVGILPLVNAAGILWVVAGVLALALLRSGRAASARPGRVAEPPDTQVSAR